MTSSALQPLPEAPGVEHIYVNAGGLRTHVAVAGPKDGEPVVLLHGWPQHWWLWRNVMPPLSEAGYRVYAPDLRGLGWSEATHRIADYDKRNLAKDIVALLDALELDSVYLAGHDWGGWTGFLVAMDHPERVKRFVAMNIPPPWLDPGPFDLKASLKALSNLWYQVVMSTPGAAHFVLAGRGRSIFAKSLVGAADNRDAFSREIIATYLDQFIDRRRSRATTGFYRRFLLGELPAIQTGKYVKGRLSVPSKLLFGLNDVAVDPAILDADHSLRADDLQIERVENCGHFIVDERPEYVTERLLDFFA